MHRCRGLSRVSLAWLVSSVLFATGPTAATAESSAYHPPHTDPSPATLAARNAALLRGAKTAVVTTEDLAAKDGSHGDAAVTSDRYDMRRYALDLTIDPSATTITGTVALVFASRVASLNELVLDLTDALTVSAITHTTGELAFTHAGDSLVVVLPQPLASGAVDSVTVAYGGIPPVPATNRGLMFKVHHPDTPDAAPVVANMSEPAYAKYWWPCKDRPDDKALTSVRLTVPESLVAVSNGLLIDEHAAMPGWRTYVWREDYPIAAYLVSVAVSDYTLLSEDCTTSLGSQIPLRNWIFPPDVPAAQVDLQSLCDMLDFCEQIVGPYPFLGEKYGHAEFLWPRGAMEHQTVTSLDEHFLDGEQGGRFVIVHELSHQWFGDSLTPHEWADIWLNEGFATYSEALWAGSDYEGGEAAYFDYMQDELANPFHWNAFGPVYDPSPVLQPVVYTKGAWILHMLRGRLGDTDFFALLHAWTNDDGRPYNTVTTADFVALASEFAGEDLTAFFEPWLTTEAVPRVWMQHTVSDGPRGAGTRLQIHLQQVQTQLFDNVYPVQVTTSAGDTTVTVPLATVSTQQVFDLAGAVDSVTLDPQRWVYWVSASAPAPDPKQVGVKLVYPNPCRSYVVVRYYLDVAEPVHLRIVDARGQSVYERDLGVVTPDGEFNEVAWDLNGRGGGTVGGGVYWVVLDVAGSRTVGKFAVVH